MTSISCVCVCFKCKHVIASCLSYFVSKGWHGLSCPPSLSSPQPASNGLILLNSQTFLLVGIPSDGITLWLFAEINRCCCSPLPAVQMSAPMTFHKKVNVVSREICQPLWLGVCQGAVGCVGGAHGTCHSCQQIWLLEVLHKHLACASPSRSLTEVEKFCGRVSFQSTHSLD